MSLLNRLLLHPTSKDSGLRPKGVGVRLDDIMIDTVDGALSCWHVLGPRSPSKTLFHFHGNAGNVTTHWPQAAWAMRFGLDIFMFDYSGFGRSDGRADLDTCVRNATSILNHPEIEARLRSPVKIVLAQSLGGYVFLQARHSLITECIDPNVDGVILDSTFGDVEQLLQRRSFGLARFVIGRRLTHPGHASDIMRFDVRTAVIHGLYDFVVPVSFGQALADAVTPKPLRLFHHLRGHMSFFPVQPPGQFAELMNHFGLVDVSQSSGTAG